MTHAMYTNPILDADWSDPDVLRVGEDFCLTASSLGRALQRLEPAAEFRTRRHDCGVWDPSLRRHADRFWICWGDPDQGVFQVNAPEIHGPWTRPHLVKAGKGLVDPCPLWDEETGEAYLAHAWAKSRSGVKNRLTGHRTHLHALRGRLLVIRHGKRLPRPGAGRSRLSGPDLIPPTTSYLHWIQKKRADQ